MKYFFLLFAVILFAGCEKSEKWTQYIAEISFDDSAADHSIVWDDSSGTPISISKSPRQQSVFVPEGKELHVTATYRNGITKAIEVKIKTLNGNLVASEVGNGFVEVRYQP